MTHNRVGTAEFTADHTFFEVFMAQPQLFKQSYVALHSIPYTEMNGSELEESLAGGVLGAGQVVWADHLHQRQPSRVTAFLDSVGVVSLDPRWLVTPEVYQSARR